MRPLEHVECYDLTKGKRQTLHLAVVRQGDSDPSRTASDGSPDGQWCPLEQSLVK